MKDHKVLTLASAIAAATALAPSVAGAQQQAAAIGLEEITVTAERYSTTLQTTPIAVSAFSADSLEQRQVTNVLEAAQIVPGIMITPATGTSNAARIHMRGAGQENSGILFDPAVGVYIDNVYQPRINGQFFDFFDIERLEVLRGPQGTLYGRNSNGGAIKIVTKRPSQTWTIAGDVAYGTYQSLDGRVYMSGPIVADKLATSFSAVSRKRDGWTTDSNYSTKLNAKNQQAARAKLLFTPSDAFEIEVAADVQKDRSDPGFGTMVLSGFTPNPKAVVGRNLFESELSGPYGNKNDSNGLSVNASYTVSPEFTLSSITGYRLQRASLAVPFTQTGAGLNIGSSYQFKDKFWSEELDASFKFDRLRGVAGFYYFHETGHQLDGVPIAYSTPDIRDRLVNAAAGFVNATYDIVEGLGLTAGVRYTHEKSDFTQFYFTQRNFSQPASTTFNAWTPKFGIDWQAMEDLLIYASFTRGFKSGGWNAVAPNTNIGIPGATAGPTLYNPETVKSYEAGAKFTTPDKQLRVNIAVFRADYGGLQLPVFFPGTVNTYTSNATTGRVQGIEIEPTWNVTPEFTIYGMGSFESDKYTGAFNCSLYNTQIVNCQDKKLKGAIPAKTSLGFRYSPPIGVPGKVTLSSDWNHNSKYYNNVSNTLDIVQTPREDIFNAAISWESEDARWRVTFEGKNITDQRYALESLQLASATAPSITAFPADPRTFDLRVRFSY